MNWPSCGTWKATPSAPRSVPSVRPGQASQSLHLRACESHGSYLPEIRLWFAPPPALLLWPGYARSPAPEVALRCLALHNLGLQVPGTPVYQRHQFLLTVAQLTDPDSVCTGRHQQHTQAAKQAEPRGLVEMWLEIQINGSAAGVPDSVVVGGQDTKL